MTTEDRLISKYGILMTVTDLAHLLNRSDDGIRVTLQSKSALGVILRPERLKIGRRVYFRAAAIAKLLDNGFLL